ncbi:MAG: pyridoxal phosphate-dependent aminotransferase [Candidatus Bipolaricaulia bacterium]
MPALSQRVSRLAPSATMAVQARAAELRAEGARLVNFGIGEPDFPTPDPIKRAAQQAIDANFTGYTNAGGIPELREAVATKYERDSGASFDPPTEVMITVGGKGALFNAALALLDDGDEVVLPTPYWVTFPQQAVLCGADVVTVNPPAEQGFVLTARDLEPQLSERTKLIILNFPNNPSGAVVEREELGRMIELARQYDAYLISDETYERFIYEGRPLSAAEFEGDHLIIVGSCSKTYAMTGWRIGWAAGPSEVIKAMETIQSQSTSNPTSIAQKAAVEALTGDQSYVSEMIDAYRQRRDALVEGLNELPGVSCNTPQGAFYVFPDISRHLSDDVPDATAFATHLLEEAGLVTVTGLAFGRDGHVRLSYAASMAEIEEGLQRLRKVLA